MIELYGHPFSSYTWKALIPLYANGTPFEFRHVYGGDEAIDATVQRLTPGGLFPLLVDGEAVVFEASAVVEYLDRHYPGEHRMLPGDPEAAFQVRLLDRVFDHYVMDTVARIVRAYIAADGGAPDAGVVGAALDALGRAYRWLEDKFARDGTPQGIDLVTCAAAPSLFYADWVLPIGDDLLLLKAYRAHLLALPPVARCVEDARPYRDNFPPGAPDRD